MVATTLGHESITTTHQHYTDPSAVENAKQRKVMEVIEGPETEKAGSNDWKRNVVTGQVEEPKYLN